MSNDFIKREEFTSEVRALRADIKEYTSDISQAIQSHGERVLEDLKETAEKIQLITLKQAIQERSMEALESMPQLEGIKDVMEMGFDGVNKRLDKVNGQIDRHTREITAQATETQQIKQDIKALQGSDERPGMTNGRKVAVVGVSGVSILAVLHSLFEMIRTIAPEIVKFFSKQ